MGHYHDVAADLREPTRDLRKAIPDTWGGFADLHAAAMADGALPTRIKELMALIVGVVKHCDGCVAYHPRRRSGRRHRRRGRRSPRRRPADGRRARQRVGPASPGRLPRVRLAAGREHPGRVRRVPNGAGPTTTR